MDTWVTMYLNGVGYKAENLPPADPSRERLQCNGQSTKQLRKNTHGMIRYHDTTTYGKVEDSLGHQQSCDLQACNV